MKDPRPDAVGRRPRGRRLFVAAAVVALGAVVGTIWYSAAASAAPLNRCRHGDQAACRVVVAQEEQQPPGSSASGPQPAPPSAPTVAPVSPQSVELEIKEQAACAGLKGTWDGACHIDYRSPTDGQLYQYVVSFDRAGDVIPAPCGDDSWAESHDCHRYPVPAQQARADCLDGSYTSGAIVGEWHADTQICSV